MYNRRVCLSKMLIKRVYLNKTFESRVSCMKEILLLLFLQIVLESLPVSSSGHFVLLEKFFSLGAGGVWTQVLDHFSHGPTVLIILLVFRREWWGIMRACLRWPAIFFKIAGLTIISCSITSFFYLIIRVLLADVTWLQSDGALAGGFFISTVALFSLISIRRQTTTYESWSIRKALILGCVQGIALLPGISRFATTYVAGRWLHLPPRRAFQISFLIQLPLIIAAFVQGLYKIVGTSEGALLVQGRGLLTLVLAAVIGFFALRFAQKLAYQEKFWWFGFYLLVPTLFLLGSIVFGQY